MSDKKNYTGKNLINNSFFVHFILQIEIPDIERLCKRMDEIVKENPEYCTPENFSAMSNAITALALYEMFKNKGNTKQQAYYKVAEAMWEFCGELSYKVCKKIRSKKSFDRLYEELPRKLSKLSSAYSIEVSRPEKNEIRLKCSRCIYESFFRKYYLKDIAAMFCYGENIIFGYMKSAELTISDTLILNDRPCGFSLRERTAKPGK